MGLDVVFTAGDAIKAGAHFFMLPNGTVEEVARALAEGNPSEAEWLQEQRCYMDIGAGRSDEPHIFEVYNKWPSPEDRIDVRANKWGRSYAPLTEWMRKHNIEWEEW